MYVCMYIMYTYVLIIAFVFKKNNISIINNFEINIKMNSKTESKSNY
jgi:hypothetical protein